MGIFGYFGIKSGDFFMWMFKELVALYTAKSLIWYLHWFAFYLCPKKKIFLKKVLMEFRKLSEK